MCILLFSVNANPKADEFHLVLVNIRDEMFDRPTRLAGFWPNFADIIGGMDMEPGKQGGTWLAMNKNGRIGALLNILQPDHDILPNKKGRGFLAVNFVNSYKECVNYLSDLNSEKIDYNGFLLVLLDLRDPVSPTLAYYSNSTESPPVILEPGIHCFGNSKQPSNPWPKVRNAKDNFSGIIESFGKLSTKSVLVEKLFEMLRDKTSYGLDDNMRQQGNNKPESFMKKLSAIFVGIPESNYGSRCHTVILIDASRNVDYYERSRKEVCHPENDVEWVTSHYQFKLQH